MQQFVPFFLPIYVAKIEDWEEKKKLLLDLPDFSDENSYEDGRFSDYHTILRSNPHPYMDKFSSIIQDDLVNMIKTFGVSFYIDTLWCQRYSLNNHMGPHTHGSGGLSAVLYAEFDKKEHQPTVFMSPFKNYRNGKDMTWKPEVEEGDVVIFPSLLLHYAPPSNSNKYRTIFSWNMYESND